MKKIVALALITITFNLSVMGQKQRKYKEIRLVTTSEVINVSADSVWQIIGPGFQNVGGWLKGINHSEGLGSAKVKGATCNARTCEVDFPGFDEITEEILTYSDEKKEISYTATKGMPGFVVYNRNQWNIKVVGPNQCVATTDATMHLKRFMGSLFGRTMEKNFKKALKEIMTELKAYAETGEISETKKEQLAQLEKKNK
ncbi:MAG: hypothetical protein COA58_10605 [Bacteroidetes bacterium]|nr:MAG: hypothetical protein COA58_10605 [Bacteroidota bacterium]